MALLLVALTGSGLGVSGAVLAEIAPVLLLAPLAGSLVDRPRVKVMVTADLVRVLLAGALAVWHDSAAGRLRGGVRAVPPGGCSFHPLLSRCCPQS